MSKLHAGLLFIAITAFTGCAENRQAPVLPDFARLVQESYITPFKEADTERWMQVFSEDAVGMHNTLPPFVGKAAIRQFADMVAHNLDIEQMDIAIDDIRVNNGWALTRGSFISKFVPKNIEDSSTINAQQGKFILLWERQADGEWKVILDMGNSNQPSARSRGPG